MTATATNDAVLELRHLDVEFPGPDGYVRAVDDVSLTIRRGESLGLVGESGSGKSQTFLAALGLTDRTVARVSGEALWFGRDLLTMGRRELAEVRGRGIGYISQNPTAALNPTLPIGAHIVDVVKEHGGVRRRAARTAALELLERVGFVDPVRIAAQYCHELSGGMRQRVVIACAIASNPILLIADEPTTALDVTVQAEIADLVSLLVTETSMSLVWISHDMGVIAQMSETVAVMYGGRIIEYGVCESIYDRSAHPYTRGLLSTIVRNTTPTDAWLPTIAGSIRDRVSWHEGCAFYPRCDAAADVCLAGRPGWATVDQEAAVHHGSLCVNEEARRAR